MNENTLFHVEMRIDRDALIEASTPKHPGINPTEDSVYEFDRQCNKAFGVREYLMKSTIGPALAVLFNVEQLPKLLLEQCDSGYVVLRLTLDKE